MGFPKIGSQAPAFTLLNQDGEQISLADYTNAKAGKKHVVLYFYPKAMTPGCTTQACGIRDAIADFNALDAVVLAVSPDPVSRLAKFKEKQALNFNLLSDEEHKVTEEYGAWGLKKFMGREFMGVLRTTFIIGKDGRVKHLIDKVKTKTHHQDVVTLLGQMD